MVAPLVGAALIGGASSLLGGLFGSNSAEKAAEKNAKLQKEFAQSGIQWKVEDAKKAGVHPLAALGAQTVSFTPSSVGSSALGDGIAGAGQSIQRAIEATRPAEDKLTAIGKTAQALSIQKMGLENDLLASQIAVTNAQLTPSMPTGSGYNMPGQPGSGVKTVPLEINAGSAAHPWSEAGPVTDMGFTRTNSGLAPVYSNDAKQRLEDDWGGMLAWNVRNRLLPTLGFNNPPPGKPAPGYAWQFNPIKQEYYQVRLGN